MREERRVEERIGGEGGEGRMGGEERRKEERWGEEGRGRE